VGLGNWQAASKALSHRGLNLMALACLAGSAVALVLYVADPRELLGVPLWEKPLKFLISGALYSVTFSWLYSFVDKGKKLAHLMGNLIAILLVVEIFLIAGLGASGTTSHFNVSTPFHIAIWSVMAAAITGVWVSTFLLGATLWNAPRMASELRRAVRWALGLGLAGMGIAFTMTPPQPQQVLPENWQGIAGAHTVGAADGGPGILSWLVQRVRRSSRLTLLRIARFTGFAATGTRLVSTHCQLRGKGCDSPGFRRRLRDAHREHLCSGSVWGEHHEPVGTYSCGNRNDDSHFASYWWLDLHQGEEVRRGTSS